MRHKLINTTLGLVEEKLLEKRAGSNETDNEITNWIEYWLDGVLVHRSVHVHLKRNVFAEGITKILE
jgi:hypothetical protein